MKNNDQCEHKAMAEKMLKMLVDYKEISQLGLPQVLQQNSPKIIARKLQLEKWIRYGGLNKDEMEPFLQDYFANTQHMHHPAYIGHQVATPHWGASLADMLNGVLNNPMAIYEMGPAAAVIERVLINWLLEKVGWFNEDSLSDFQKPKSGCGVFTHGGSLANLTAVLAARSALIPQAWSEGVPKDCAVIAPASGHYSIARAFSIAGFGQSAIFKAPVSPLEVLLPEMLESTYQLAVDSGRRPIMVSINACATATGLYDPIDEVADFCEQHNLWLHVDGAHGASALLSEKEVHLMKGVQRADSLVWDAHKMLRTSALCAVALFRKPEYLEGAFQQKGSYIFHEKEEVGFDVLPYAVECTKGPIAEKLFWVLAIDGEQRLAEYVERQYQITRDFYRLISSHDKFYCPYQPESNILCFKYLPVADNDKQLKLRYLIIERGHFYITSAEICGVRYLRIAIMNELTTIDTIQALIEEIERVAKEAKLEQS
ncbi:pyridoxal phosphate-dependent decarboxylase family protein [Aliikangiella sp. IMCC44359]|uniref:pyridoxal phosphate-dependent decarboxylase family protein n=1 Tax=Aliikangiella sp. IMCC44359 TaxID=3459125 RepID=UPI00403A99D5